MKLHSLSFGAACGLALGSAVAAATFVSSSRAAKGERAGQTLRGLSAVFPRYNPYRKTGIWIGLGWGLAYGFVGGLVFAIVYNILAGILGGKKA